MLILLTTLACSTRNTRQESCVSASECHELFGLGYTCVQEGDSAGFCDLVTPIDRCSYTNPAGVFDWDNKDQILIGAIFETTYDLPIIKAVDLATKSSQFFQIAGAACDNGSVSFT